MDDLIDRDDDPQVGRSLGLSRRQLLAATTGVAAAAALGSAAMGGGSGACRGVRLGPRRRERGPGPARQARHHPVHRPGRDQPRPEHHRPALRVPGGVPGAVPDRVQAGRVRRVQPARERARREREQHRRRAAAAHLAGRQRPGGRGQPRLDPVHHHRRQPGRVRRAVRDREHPRASGTSAPATTPPAASTSPTGRPPPNGGTSSAQRAATHGLKLYTHNHDAAYNFLLDSGPLDVQGRPTRSSGTRRLEYFLANTDPNYVYLEMDIYWAHVAQYRWHTYTAPDGTVLEDLFDPAGTVAAQTTRFPLFHTKDGRINTAVTNGYEMVPFGTGRHRLHHVLPDHRRQGLRTTRCTNRTTPPNTPPRPRPPHSPTPPPPTPASPHSAAEPRPAHPPGPGRAHERPGPGAAPSGGHPNRVGSAAILGGISAGPTRPPRAARRVDPARPRR